MKLKQYFQVQELIRKEFGDDYTSQQLSILLLCALRPAITYKEIADALNISQSAVSRKISKLCSSIHPFTDKETGYGFVESRTDEIYDSRRKSVHLTKKGKQFIAKIQKAIKE